MGGGGMGDDPTFCNPASLQPGTSNLFANIRSGAGAEIFETILSRPGVRVERILSFGQATPPGEWYDQGWDEWVLLLSGSAGLLIEGEPTARILRPGDCLMLPAHCRHRVDWTEQDQDTIWLAIHFDQPDIFRNTGGDHVVLHGEEKEKTRNPA